MRMPRWGLDRAVLPVVMGIALVRLIWHTGLLRRDDVIVVMPEGGFGHTITGPDVSRRLFAGRRCVFIALSEYGRHNWKVATIWPDIDVVFLPLNLGVRVGPPSFFLGPLALA